MAKEVIYQTPTGESATGYIIDEKTFKDPYGEERIEIGSVVPTAGGTYLYTGEGGVKTPGSMVGDVQKAYAAQGAELRSGYDAKTQAIDLATQRRGAEIERQKQAANQRYADANRRAYGAYVSASNPYGALGEQTAKLGLANSGYAESSKMQLANTYQQALSANERQKNEYLNELEAAYIDAKYQGDIEKANALAEYHNLVYKHGIDTAEAVMNMQLRAYESGNARNQEIWERQDRAAEKARETEAMAWQNAYNLAKMGVINADIARTLGVSMEELKQAMER